VEEYFIRSAAFLLAFSGVMKVMSTAGDAQVLADLDPLFHIRMRPVLLFIGCSELALSWVLFSEQFSSSAKPVLVLWISSCFIIYRAGLVSIGFHGYCACMGQVFSILGIEDTVASNILVVLVIYMFTGSLLILLIQMIRKQRRKSPKVGVVNM
jgi:hypothetical protein